MIGHNPAENWEPEFLKMVEEEWALWKGKGSEYTCDLDRLHNFNSVAEMLGVSPMIVWAVYAAKHFYAILNYAKTGKEGVEGIESRLTDLAVYAKLGRLIVQQNSPSEVRDAIDLHDAKNQFKTTMEDLKKAFERAKQEPVVQPVGWEPWRRTDG